MKAPETMKLSEFMKFIHVGYTKFYKMMENGGIDARKTYKEGRYRTIEVSEAHRVKNNILEKVDFNHDNRRTTMECLFRKRRGARHLLRRRASSRKLLRKQVTI